MPIAIYLTHPQVEIDKDVAVPNWNLSEMGLSRAKAASSSAWAKSIDQIISSKETKALQTAQCFADALSLDVFVGDNLAENDRSSTGFLPSDQFEHAADCFMEKPNESFKGWERAIDAQSRIVAGVDAAMRSRASAECVLIVGHGGVGTLLKCHIANRKIARKEDQPGNGGGNIFAFDLETRSLLCEWMPMEDFSGTAS